MERVERKLCTAVYFSRFSREAPPFRLSAKSEIASASSDHLWPHGTLHDNSCNPAFNRKLCHLLNYKPDLRVLDLGCSGGAFVRSILEDGYTAIGLEGSDVSKKLQGGEWGAIPLHLFTCDIAAPFTICFAQGKSVLFDVVTAWEVLEHIPEQMISGLADNIFRNLREGGFFIASVATFRDSNPISGAVYHCTVKSREWWLEKFSEKGFEEFHGHSFQTGDWVRGNGKGLTDWHPDDGHGFHLVLRKR